MKRAKVQLTLVFVHRDKSYRAKVSEWLASHAKAVGVELGVREAGSLGSAKRSLHQADRVLIDGNDRELKNGVLRGDSALPMFALVAHLDAAIAYLFLDHGIIPVGRCETQLDAMFLALTIIEGSMVARTPDAKGRYAIERDIEDHAALSTALVRNNFNLRATARFLGWTYSTVWSRARKLGLTHKRE